MRPLTLEIRVDPRMELLLYTAESSLLNGNDAFAGEIMELFRLLAQNGAYSATDAMYAEWRYRDAVEDQKWTKQTPPHMVRMKSGPDGFDGFEMREIREWIQSCLKSQEPPVREGADKLLDAMEDFWLTEVEMPLTL